MSWTRRIYSFKFILRRVTSIRKGRIFRYNTYAGTGLLLSFLPSVKADENPTNNFQSSDSNHLTSVNLIKNASVMTIDSATALLTQTITALLEAEDDYADAMSRLTALMELNLQVLGIPDKCDAVWDQILNVRMQLNEIKVQKENLEMLFSCAEKVLIAAAETAYLSGANYAGVAASERLHSAKCELERARKTSTEAEQEMKVMEVKSIHTVSARAKDDDRQKTQQQSSRYDFDRDDDDENI
ncbi:hypothetical protein NP493_90g05001 [Ridgeia piscesae]|uniref:Direct IAP-binding protein with low pI n=1 Tax=Ridgeia piscesae TaxID=27915 RepID=A0AAD9UI51_RIDPI|nr:hypothetical protein NP493_90g05001 [Ridgeia piscesae]